MKRKLILIVTIVLSGLAARVNAQVDPHFSQFYAYPLWLNPALTGVFNGGTRFSANFKDQWAGISDGYVTTGISADFKTTSKLSLGVNVIDQSAGTAGYNYLGAYGTIGYSVPVSSSGTQKLSFGLQVGVINRGFNPGNVQTDNQYNPGSGYDPNLPSGENFLNTSATVFDAAAGIYYYDTDADNPASLFGGIAVAHLANSNDPFATDGIKSKLPIRYTIHGGLKIRASDIFDITPGFMYIRQQQNQISVADLNSEIKFQDNYGLLLGAMYRFNDAAVADVGYHLKNTIIGISYDFNTSPLKSATSGQGGFELSISYVLDEGANGPANSIPRF